MGVSIDKKEKGTFPREIAARAAAPAPARAAAPEAARQRAVAPTSTPTSTPTRLLACVLACVLLAVAAISTAAAPEAAWAATRIEAPEVATDLVYTGELQTGVLEGVGYTLSGTAKATAAGSYTAVAKLKAGYTWTDGSRAEKTCSWSIARAKVRVPKTSGELTYTGASQTGVTVNASCRVSGTIEAVDAGSYTAIIALPDDENYIWSDGTLADKKLTWTIAKREVAVPVVKSSQTWTGAQRTGVTLPSALYAWGDNDNGRLGDGTKKASSAPVRVKENVASVSLGYGHSAAIKTGGTLWMWGRNKDGELGDGTEVDSSTPVKVMSGVAAVSLGAYHSAAIKTDGSLWLWGNNDCGQIGNGTYTHASVPVKVLDDVVAVSLGAYHSAALTSDGSLWMWGWNAYGQLGDGTTTDSAVPVKVMDGVASIALGGCHSAAIKTDGTLWMWGDNNSGQLGNGTTRSRSVPVKVMSGVVSVSLGYDHSAAIKTNGTLWMWGDNWTGQLGNGKKSSKSSPVKVMDGVASVALGAFHSAAVKTDGTLWMWGRNKDGQISKREAAECLEPVKVMAGVGSVSLGYSHSAAVMADACVTSGAASATDAGTYTATVELGDTANTQWSDGTSGAKTLRWSIVHASLAKAKVRAIATKAYTGAAITPAPHVTLAGKTLVAGKDYTVSYKNNRKVGTATITIQGAGGYEGTVKSTFVIAYKITYKLKGGKLATENPAFYDGTKSVTLNNPTRTGYVFKGWYDASGRRVTKIAKGSTGNKVLTAKWELATYKITYKLAGGKLAKAQANPTSYTMTTETFTLAKPTREGYTFKGWYDANGVRFTKIAKGSTGNRVLTAKWVAKTS